LTDRRVLALKYKGKQLALPVCYAIAGDLSEIARKENQYWSASVTA